MWPFSPEHNVGDKLPVKVAGELHQADGERIVLDLRPKTICFLIIELLDGEPESSAKALADVFDILSASEGAISAVIYPFVITSFDVPLESQEKREHQCRSAANTLIQTLGSSCRILTGSITGMYGLFGSARYVSYGPIIPGFSKVFFELASVGFGNVKHYIEKN